MAKWPVYCLIFGSSVSDWNCGPWPGTVCAEKHVGLLPLSNFNQRWILLPVLSKKSKYKISQDCTEWDSSCCM